MLAPASVACIPRQLLPLLAVRPSSIQRLGSRLPSKWLPEPPTPEPRRRLRVLSSRPEMKEKRNGSHTGDR